MIGMDRHTGAPISGAARRRQSVEDILLTRIGSRVCQREYGSELPDLIDAAMNPAGRIRIYAATAAAIARWEPELRLQRVQLTPAAEAGAWRLDLDTVDLTTGSPLALALSLPSFA